MMLRILQTIAKIEIKIENPSIIYNIKLVVKFSLPPLGEAGRGLLLTVLLVVLNQFRNSFFNRARDDVVGNLIDGRVGVVVDGDDDA